MIVIIGYKQIPKLLGVVDEYECPKCVTVSQWELLIIEKYFTFFFVPIIPRGANYSVVCEKCGHRTYLTKTDFGYYKRKQEIDLAFSNKEITSEERESSMSEINATIDQGKALRENIALEESQKWNNLVSGKEDLELLAISQFERHKYEPSFIAAVQLEIEKRKLTD